MPRIATLLTAVTAAAVLLPAAGAAAGPRDRDHDHMPDRWERVNHLKVGKNDARKDADHDGLINLAEYRAHTDPRDRDTDDDGITDGAEDAGKVTSFADGVLTITTFGGQTLVGRVTGDTEIECPDAAAPMSSEQTATTRSAHGDDDAEAAADGAMSGGGDEHGDDVQGEGDGEHGDDAQAEDGGESCGTEVLVGGARVDEAQLSVTHSGNTWRTVELAG